MIRLLKKQTVPKIPPVCLESARLLIRPPAGEDCAQWLAVRRRNREFLEPWEPQWAPDALTEAYFYRRCERQRRDWRDDGAYAFLIFRRDGDDLIGGININNVCRAVAQFASLGYWISEDCEGQGYMDEALRLVIAYGFEELNLHRFNAGCLAYNERSKNLLLRLGFSEEGFAKRYLKINGAWQDHILFGLTIEDWRQSRVAGVA